jgi:hypothetical protein
MKDVDKECPPILQILADGKSKAYYLGEMK